MCRRYLDDVIVIDDATILGGLRFALERMKQVLEPAGAAGLAAVLYGHVPIGDGETVCVVASGGNVEIGRIGQPHRGRGAAARLRVVGRWSATPGSRSTADARAGPAPPRDELRLPASPSLDSSPSVTPGGISTARRAQPPFESITPDTADRPSRPPTPGPASSAPGRRSRPDRRASPRRSAAPSTSPCVRAAASAGLALHRARHAGARRPGDRPVPRPRPRSGRLDQAMLVLLGEQRSSRRGSARPSRGSACRPSSRSSACSRSRSRARSWPRRSSAAPRSAGRSASAGGSGSRAACSGRSSAAAILVGIVDRIVSLAGVGDHVRDDREHRRLDGRFDPAAGLARRCRSRTTSRDHPRRRRRDRVPAPLDPAGPGPLATGAARWPWPGRS